MASVMDIPMKEMMFAQIGQEAQIAQIVILMNDEIETLPLEVEPADEPENPDTPYEPYGPICDN